MVLDFVGQTTTSSVVHRRQRRIAHCRDCGGVRVDLGGPHSTQVVSGGAVRDCVGRIWKDGKPL